MIKMFRHLFGLLIVALLCFHTQASAQCQAQRIKIQVLGSGGPELNDGRASTSYLIWLDNKGVVLIDAGSGSSLNYEKTSARLNDLQVMAFSHFHVDHSADFAAYVKAFYFSHRNKPLSVLGPAGNDLMPSASEFSNRFSPLRVYILIYRNIFNKIIRNSQSSRKTFHLNNVNHSKFISQNNFP